MDYTHMCISVNPSNLAIHDDTVHRLGILAE
jgi:hypothetical protein